MARLFQSPGSKGMTAAAIGIGLPVAFFLFLAIPLTQMFTEYEKPPERVDQQSLAADPPPPPPDEPPPPPEQEEKQEPPELDKPPPKLSLDQLEVSLNPGTGGALSGDFAMPDFGDVNQEDLGTSDVFNLDEVDSPPRAATQVKFTYPRKARRRNITGVVKIEYIVDENGKVADVTIVESPSEILSEATAEAIRDVRFSPATKGGRPVKVRMRASVPYE